MSSHNIFTVEHFLELLDAPESVPVLKDILSDKITYDVLIARPVHLNRTLRGYAEVKSYLSMLQTTYQVKEATTRTLVEVGDKVVVMGSERAWVVRLRQMVQADWNAIFELVEGRIQRVAMTIYRWTVLEDYSWMLCPKEPHCLNGSGRVF